MKKEIDLKNLSFEDALARLEAIVRELEGGKIKLDDAVDVYETATTLKKFCEDKLKKAQIKVEKINLSASEEITTSPFDTDEEK